MGCRSCSTIPTDPSATRRLCSRLIPAAEAIVSAYAVRSSSVLRGVVYQAQRRGAELPLAGAPGAFLETSPRDHGLVVGGHAAAQRRVVTGAGQPAQRKR